jgi:hypothetical protein
MGISFPHFVGLQNVYPGGEFHEQLTTGETVAVQNARGGYG